MKSLVVGAGQVGTGLYEIIKKYHESYIRDIEEFPMEGIEVLHICYPDHPKFVETTQKYIDQYKPLVTVINSSVPVGTTDKIGGAVVYSPVRGRHPNLAFEMREFPKFVSGRNINDVFLISTYFKKCQWQVTEDSNPAGVELLKLLSNIHMGLEIAWRQEVERVLTKWKVSSLSYDAWEETYNKGYLNLGQTHLVRPRMKPDPIGGHCILECTEILKRQHPSLAFDFIEESNLKTKEKKYGIYEHDEIACPVAREA